MPTYGGVISTGAAALLDGTSVRMPTRGWYLPDGTDMELNGAVPDILVPQVPQDEEANNDRQLRAAVDNLMQRLPKRALPKQGT
jgi:tricorn protease